MWFSLYFICLLVKYSIYNDELKSQPGLQCEAEIDECLSDPCSSEGTEKCLDLDNKYECQCRPGFIGSLCEVRNLI